jgi:AcrR family transcriptional regulator
MRRVAAAANITQGNLAYHYPSKRQLLREFISSLVTESVLLRGCRAPNRKGLRNHAYLCMIVHD